jgi:hypothetical protein
MPKAAGSAGGAGARLFEGLSKKCREVLFRQLTNGSEPGFLGSVRQDRQIKFLEQWLNALGVSL